MPLVQPNDTAPEAPKPSIPVIAEPTYRGVTVDTEVTPVSDLLTHVEGSSWTVDYYSQVLTNDVDLAGQGLGTPAVQQSYQLIRGFELRVTQQLSTSQNSETKALLVSGAATVYPMVIPNEGDMFLADIGSGREGVFQITNVQRMSVMDQPCHSIDYQLVNYSTDTIRADLAAKTVRKLQFEKDFLTYGQNPLLFEEEYEMVQWLRRNYKSIAERYFKSFFSKEYSTMLVPGQDTPTYDHYITRALMSNFTTWDTDEIRKVSLMNVEEDYALHATQIWDVLTKRDKNQLRDCFLQVGKVYAFEFTKNPMMAGIRYTGIQEVVYPVDPRLTVDYNLVKATKLVNGNKFTQAPVDLLNVGQILAGSRLEENIATVQAGFALTDSSGQPLEEYVPPPMIHRVMKDNYYVFSEAFYRNDRVLGKQSQLELLVHDYLDGKSIKYSRLKAMCEDIQNWNSLDRFYFVPVVMILIKAVIRSI